MSEAIAATARQLRELHRAALDVSGDLDTGRTLHTILRAAASLVRARYGALGVPDLGGDSRRSSRSGSRTSAGP